MMSNELAEQIRATHATADRLAIADERSGLDNRELFERATGVADAARQISSARSPVVAVTLPLSVDAVVMLVAAIIGDYTVCFLDPATTGARRDEVAAALRPDVLVDADGIHAAPATDERPSPASPGYIAMTSGSTGGPPKGVLCPWSTVAAFAPFGADALELGPDATWGELSHAAYDMAMTNLLVAVSSGATLRVSGGLGDRVRPLRFIERVGATHVRLAPRFIDLAVAERRLEPPTTLRVWGSGGDRLFDVQAAHLLRLGVPAVVNTYGTSESSGFASAARLVAGAAMATLHGSVSIGHGAIGPWSTHLLPQPDASEVLAIQSPYRPDGYFFGQASGEFPRWEASDRVVTGDRGAHVGDDLFCLGRAGRLVKRHAKFVDLDAIDATIRIDCGVGAFSLTTAAGALTTLVESGVADLDDLRGKLPSVLSPDILPDRLIPVRQVPRLGNGKVDHQAALQLAEQS